MQLNIVLIQDNIIKHKKYQKQYLDVEDYVVLLVQVLILIIQVVDVISELKTSVINDFLDYIDILKTGYDISYQKTLHKIAFLSIINKYPVNKVPGMYEFLINLK